MNVDTANKRKAGRQTLSAPQAETPLEVLKLPKALAREITVNTLV
jgi:hypothetical protein